MAYCQWCQLESDSPDHCVWCKRPLQGNVAAPVQRNRADIHYMKVDDDSSETQFPFYAIVGVAVFLTLIIYAAIALRPQETAPPPATLNWTLQDENNGDNTPPPSFAVTKNGQLLLLSNALQHPDPVHVPSGSNRLYTLAPNQMQPFNTPKFAQSDSGRIGANFARPNTVFFESITFAFIYDVKKVPHLVADIYIVNDTQSTLQDVHLKLSDGGYDYQLLRYDGSVNNPTYLGALSIPSRSVAACHVLAKGYTLQSMKSGSRRIELDGTLAEASVHVQETIAQ